MKEKLKAFQQAVYSLGHIHGERDCLMVNFDFSDGAHGAMKHEVEMAIKLVEKEKKELIELFERLEQKYEYLLDEYNFQQSFGD